MIDRFLTRIANARSFAGKLWMLVRPYWFAQELQRLEWRGYGISVKECWIARSVLALTIALSLLIVYISREINYWNARFFNALQDRNVEAFRTELVYWGVLAAIFIVALVLPGVAAAAADHPLAPLAERGVFPRLAGRPHLLPHGAHQPGHRQSRAAHRAGLQGLRRPNARNSPSICSCRC